MYHYYDTFLSDTGVPVNGGSVSIYLTGTVTLATIYSDNGITPKTNPTTTDILGGFDFYIANGIYDLVFSGSGVTQKTRNAVEISKITQADSTDVLTKVQTLQVVGAATLPTITGPSTVSGGGLTVASGQVLSADQAMPVNSAGIGGFWSIKILWPPNTDITSPTTICSSNNEVRVFQFVLPYAVNVGKVTVIVNTAAAGAADVGIYSASGNRLLYTNGGINSGSATTQTVTVFGGPIFLPAGTYYLAQTSSNSAAGWTGLLLSTATSFVNLGGANRMGFAANAATAGVLPATLGAITNSTTFVPVMAFFER
jgi:hypothetical protein